MNTAPDPTQRLVALHSILKDDLLEVVSTTPSPPRYALGERGNPSQGQEDPHWSEPYTLEQWECIVNLPGFRDQWGDQWGTLEDCLTETGVAAIVQTVQDLLLLLQAGRGTRFLVMLRPKQEPFDWSWTWCTSHGLLYGEYDPEERYFESPEEVLATFQQAVRSADLEEHLYVVSQDEQRADPLLLRKKSA